MKKRRLICCILVLVLLFVLGVNIQNVSNADTFLFHISVPIVTQSPYSNWCWAACGACVASYVTSTVVTKTAFANTCGVTTNIPKNLLQIKAGLANYCVSSVVYQNYMSANAIQNNIASDKPIIAVWTWYNSDGSIANTHFVVISGIDYGTSEKTIEYMDPAYSVFQYKSYSAFKHTGSREWSAALKGFHYDLVVM